MRTNRFITFIVTTTIFCAGSYAASSAQTLRDDMQQKEASLHYVAGNKAPGYVDRVDMFLALKANAETHIGRDDNKNISLEILDVPQSLDGKDLINSDKPFVYKFDSLNDYNVLFGVKPRPRTKPSYIHQNITSNDGMPKTRYIAPVKLTAGIVISRKF